jgi:lipopolysaccharide biosynthesis protein
MRRIALYLFYDERGIVDEYVTHFLRKLSDFVEEIVFTSNGPLSKSSELSLQGITNQIFIRRNEGFDAWAHKEALETVGDEILSQYDEILLLNYTYFGPIFPFSELFSEMEKRACDFWGVTAHKELVPNPFTGGGRLPAYIDGSFIAIRKPMAQSASFRAYWKHLPKFSKYEEAILLHESVFTEYFTHLGYKASTYLDSDKYGTHDPAMLDIDETVLDRNPLLIRRAFFDDPMHIERYGTDLPRALRIIKQSSDYDPELIWRNIVRSAELRNLNANAALTSVLADVRLKQAVPPTKRNIAVCAHLYYTEMLPELLALTRNIPMSYDFIATTNTLEKKREIERTLAGVEGIGKVVVRVVEQNRGRDMSSLFITCRDLFLDDTYDLVCRLHTKKTPQVASGRGQLFKRHMFENILNSEGYVCNVLDMFGDNPWIGVAVPPIVQISYSTLGHSWFSNRSKAQQVARVLQLNVVFYPDTPIAAYGTMFWFRPRALRKLFMHEWKWTDFNEEPNHIDGGLAHTLERLIGYVAQDAGYTTQQIMCTQLAEWNYAMLEYKLQKLQSCLPLGEFDYYTHILSEWKKAGYPSAAKLPFIKSFFRHRMPVLYNWLRPFYRAMRGARSRLQGASRKMFELDVVGPLAAMNKRLQRHDSIR